MKKLLLSLLLLPTAVVGQVVTTGYYRVQNTFTDRYMEIVDNRASYSVSNTDLAAFRLLLDFEDNVAFNPATICYVERISGIQYNLSGQGLDLKAKTGYYLNIYPQNGVYTIYGQAAGVEVRYIQDLATKSRAYLTYPGNDVPDWGKSAPVASATEDYRLWRFLPVDQGETTYFGIKPDVQASADDSYWSTLYMSYPLRASSSDTKIYTISVKGGYAVLNEVTGTVPGNTPVLIRCSSAAPKDNKITLEAPNGQSPIVSSLAGIYFCNEVEASTGHRNVTAYNPSTMRVLGTTADGKPAFVKSSTLQFLPANKAFAYVSASAPDVLPIVTEAEYTAGIEDITVDAPAAGVKGVYTLSGSRIADTTDGLSKGVYVVNGRKTVVK